MNRIFAVLAVLMPFLASGQSEKVVFGVKAGLNYNNIIVKGANLDIPLGQFNPALEGKEVEGTGGFNFDPLTSWYAGVTVDVPVKKWFHVQAELLYTVNAGKGAMAATLEDNPYIPGFPTSISRPEKLKLSYLQVPVLAKFYPVRNLPLMVGPYVGFGVSFRGKATEIPGAVEKNIHYMYKTMDFGFVGGAAYEFGFGLFVEARYVFGAMKTLRKHSTLREVEVPAGEGQYMKVDIKAYTADITGQNNSFQCGVGYRF